MYIADMNWKSELKDTYVLIVVKRDGVVDAEFVALRVHVDYDSTIRIDFRLFVHVALATVE